MMPCTQPTVSQLPDVIQPDWPISQPEYIPTVPPSNGSSATNPLTPQLFPNEPQFNVPSNPLLPPGYQEVLTYSQLQYLNGFLRTQIGNYCQVTVMVGTNNSIERAGILLAVGINYILLMDPDSNEILTVDFTT